jgi:acyl-CoA thioesterase I
MRRLAYAAAFAALVASGAGVRAATPPIDAVCQVPAALVAPNARLERVAALRAAGKPVKVVVLGTGSSAGAGVSNLRVAYPARLEHWLAQSWGSAAVSVLNVARTGQTTDEMAQALPGIMKSARPDLVVWQTGTVDAMRGVDINDFAAALGRGIEAARAGGADVILMNAQFGSPAFALRNVGSYLEYLDQIARSYDVPVFARYEIMKHWVETGALSLAKESPEAQRRTAERVHDCVAQLLALEIRLGSDK